MLALALGGGVLALRLKPSAGTDTFVSRSSSSYQATHDDRHFGSDPVVILIREPLTELVETKDLATVSQLEACLAGQVVVDNQQLPAFTPAPAIRNAYGGWDSPCGKLMKAQPAQVVYGPGTFLNRAVAAVNTEVTPLEAAQRRSRTPSRARISSRSGGTVDASRRTGSRTRRAGAQDQQTPTAPGVPQLGDHGPPRIDDPQFIPQIVFDRPRRTSRRPGSRICSRPPTRR